ncbi:MAG: caspase family protein [Bacteriovorax sp.]|jgi:hypothetical protein|nr:caspase family protein [Bacteriovorax sp.]
MAIFQSFIFMHPLKNLILFLSMLLSFNLWAKFNSCENSQDSLISGESPSGVPFTVYLGMDRRNLGELGVFGADVDQEQSENISKILFGTQKINSIMPTAKNTIEGSAKKFILEQFYQLKIKAGQNAKINFFYSGHGYRCRDVKTQIEHWCLGVGHKSYSEKSPKVTNEANLAYEIISPLGEKTYLSADDVITEEELMSALAPQNMILDSCHSGIASDILLNRKDKIAGRSGVFVLASSLSDQVSSGHEQKGGIFYNTLLRMLRSNKKKLACLMDWDGRGEISDRALTVGLMLAFTPDDYKIPTSKELKDFSHQEQLKNGISSTIEKHEYQLSVSNPNGSCLLKHNFQCPKKDESLFVARNSCDKVLLEHRKMKLSIDEMINGRNVFREVLDHEIRNDPGQYQRSFRPKGQSDVRVINPYREKVSTDSFGAEKGIMLFLEKFKYDLEEEYNVKCPLEIDANGCYRNEVKVYHEDLEKMLQGVGKIFDWEDRLPKTSKKRGAKGN